MNKEDKIINDFLKKELKSIKNVFESKTFKCTIYFLNYVYQNDLESLRKYTSLYSELSDMERIQVLANIYAHFKENNKNENQEKVKIKGE